MPAAPEAGLKVALLEAGRPQSDKNFSELSPHFPFEVPQYGCGASFGKTRPVHPSSMSATSSRPIGSQTISKSRTPREGPAVLGWAGCA